MSRFGERDKEITKDIVNKCKDHLKLIYSYINGKLKNKGEISKLKISDEIYENAEEMAEVINNCFQSVFTGESDFQCQRAMVINEVGLCEIQVAINEIRKIMEEQDVREASGPDGVSSWIVRECSQQLADNIHSVIMSFLAEGKVPIER